MSERSRYHVEALSRGLAVLRMLSLSPGPLLLSDIAERGGMNITTAFRIVQTLAALGYVERIGSRKAVRLAWRAIRLGYGAFTRLDLPELALPALERLHRTLGDGVYLSVLAMPDIVSLIRLVPPDRRHMVGHVFPAYATPEGKLLLAHLEPRRRALQLEMLPEVLPSARGSLRREELVASLDAIRDQGWAATDEEIALGTRGVAVPLVEAGACIAAVSVVVTRYRRTVEELHGEVLERLRATAEEVNALLALRLPG